MRHVKVGGCCLLVLAWLCVVDQASAQRVRQRQAPATSDETETMSDADFVKMASAAGLAEVNMGMMGEKHATNPEVRRFAQRMVEDHQTANKQLMAIADRKGMHAASAMDQQHRDMADKMADMQGARFDRSFMDHMVTDHEKAVRLFEMEAKDGKDQDLRAFAEKTLPILREHLKMAKDIARSAGHSGR